MSPVEHSQPDQVGRGYQMAIRGFAPNIASDRLSGRNSGYGRLVAMIMVLNIHIQITEQVSL